ncbi:MAG: DNA mismatch repair endonuclease MutL [Phycisphaerales bacterium]|nr:DNA mismatch repair endonuclease MutL [Phycisphaerales bacterium]
MQGDIIQMLPDSIANQIAAGEVIQRPAYAVKELLENAIDAQATKINLVIEDAGKQLIQVVDNGVGMSELDARMSFERHATSKLRHINDLSSIRSMGFRGEALASIAAVSEVVLKTRRADQELGVHLCVENSKVVKQEPCACAVGTTLIMKNLFFNVPARKNFLKSTSVEMRYIIDEFIHIAIPFYDIAFTCTHNDKEIFNLPRASLKQRIINVLGSTYQTKLIPINESTNYVRITGFVGKPETVKKTRGEQYIFINNRFIKNHSINHAVIHAFDRMIEKDTYPIYFLFLELDPKDVDVNVHPTKQEIKFADDKLIYAFVQSAVRHALASYRVLPGIDFTLDAQMQQTDALTQSLTNAKREETKNTDIYKVFTNKNQAHLLDNNEASRKLELENWHNFFENTSKKNNDPSTIEAQPDVQLQSLYPLHDLPNEMVSTFFQVGQCYIFVLQTNKAWIVHQQYAHERVLYEKLIALQKNDDYQTVSKPLLFPVTVDISLSDQYILTDLLPSFRQYGFDIDFFGKHSVIIRSIPATLNIGDEKELLESVIDNCKEHFKKDIDQTVLKQQLAIWIAKKKSIKLHTPLSPVAMSNLWQDLLTCDIPAFSPEGYPCFIECTSEFLQKFFVC